MQYSGTQFTASILWYWFQPYHSALRAWMHKELSIWVFFLSLRRQKRCFQLWSFSSITSAGRKGGDATSCLMMTHSRHCRLITHTLRFIHTQSWVLLSGKYLIPSRRNTAVFTLQRVRHKTQRFPSTHPLAWYAWQYSEAKHINENSTHPLTSWTSCTCLVMLTGCPILKLFYLCLRMGRQHPAAHYVPYLLPCLWLWSSHVVQHQLCARYNFNTGSQYHFQYVIFFSDLWWAVRDLWILFYKHTHSWSDKDKTPMNTLNSTMAAHGTMQIVLVFTEALTHYSYSASYDVSLRIGLELYWFLALWEDWCCSYSAN